MSVLYKMPIDLYRDGDHYTLNADLPGIDPKSVDLGLNIPGLSSFGEDTAGNIYALSVEGDVYRLDPK